MSKSDAETETSLAEMWDDLWTQRLSDNFWRRHSQVSFQAESFMEFLPLFRERNVKRILLPGNGCSLLPHALVHCGFDVTVLDISHVANDSVAVVQPIPELITCFLRERKPEYPKSNVWIVDKEASLKRVAEEAVSGGELNFVTADILNWQTDKQFDLLYDDRTAMLFPQEDWAKVARKYFQFLNADSICFIETINLGGTMGDDVSGTRNPFEQAFRTAGFTEHEFFIRREPLIQKYPRRGFLDLFKKKNPVEEQYTSRLTAPPPGGKQICFWHGSG